MSSEARLYNFSQDTRTHLRKFSLSTSRSKEPQAVIYLIDKNSYEIKQQDQTVYNSLEDISDALPDNSPRFVLLSYPLTLTDDGCKPVPYVLVYYLPATCNAGAKMMYAGAKELMRSTSNVGKVFDIEDAEDILEIPAKLGQK
ncbi:Protein AIM7 [Ceratocystis lukuohia]|uniref:Protein AIM7 n=2 Tax=Ceratocystis TaxID=5157 RepID=A0A2C5XJR8_9PEZI|nr:Protein AIM7 [Ceratocystis fimbriata CBS 114723]